MKKFKKLKKKLKPKKLL